MYITREESELMRYAGLMDKGVLPVSGGALDQTRSFLDAARFCEGEDAQWKAELSKPRR